MRRVIKYPLHEPDVTLTMPTGRVVHVHEQRGDVCIWIEATGEDARVRRRFVIVGTGADVPDGGVYVGTAHGGTPGLHVYEMQS